MSGWRSSRRPAHRAANATVAGEFLAFTASRGGLAALDGAVIGAFVVTLAGYAPKTVEHKLCAVRSLLRFAAAGGLTGPGVLETVPAARSTKQARIPSVWEAADVAKVLEAIDRGNPSGKRDYAIYGAPGTMWRVVVSRRLPGEIVLV